MTHSRNRQLIPLAVLTAALVGAVTAYAATRAGGSPSSQSLSTGYAATPISSNGSGGHGPGDGPGGRHGDGLAAAATYLGVSQADLLTSLQSGKTLAQVAAATSGKSVSGLIDALVAAEKTELAAAVKAGELTQAQADSMTTDLKARVTAKVNGTHSGDDGDHPGPGGFGPGGLGGGFGGFGPPPSAPSSGSNSSGGTHI
jgi:hypothetical protein